MGNASSQPSGASAPPATNIMLYKARIRKEGGVASIEWELVGENVRPQFYDINVDASSSPTEWHLEFEGSVEYPDVMVSEGMQFQASELKCVFSAAEGAEWWALSFPDGVQYAAFQQRYNGYLFHNRYQTDPNEENVKKELGMYADIGQAHGETEESRQQWVEDMDIDEAPTDEGIRAKDRLVNRKATSELMGLVMGEGDRSYVVGREGIGVMKNTKHGLEDLDIELSFDNMRLCNTPQSTRSTRTRRSSFGAASGVSTPSSTPAASLAGCSKGILMESETKLNLLSSSNGAATIFNTDLETGGVVRELGFGNQTDIVDIINEAKGTTGSSTTFLSVGPQSVDKWDTRVGERGGLVQTMASPAVVDLGHEGGRSYKTKTKFSSIATTGKGYRAIGSRDGTIRLYNDQMGQISKTNIPSLGAPIEHIDVTYDGRWVLATTKTFLIVLKTVYKEGSKELCGFTSRLGDRAPKPRLLMLTPEDRVLTNNAPFEKAKFSWIGDSSAKERYIVATCGRYTVQWNFRAVKIAKPDIVTNGLTTVQNYTLIPKSEEILDTTFMHTLGALHSPNSLVVLTKQRVWNVDEEGQEAED